MKVKKNETADQEMNVGGNLSLSNKDSTNVNLTNKDSTQRDNVSKKQYSLRPRSNSGDSALSDDTMPIALTAFNLLDFIRFVLYFCFFNFFLYFFVSFVLTHIFAHIKTHKKYTNVTIHAYINKQTAIKSNHHKEKTQTASKIRKQLTPNLCRFLVFTV